MKITKEQFNHVFPNAKDVDELLAAMKKMFKKYDINSEAREASFLAQCGHESGGFRVRTENLNYSAKALDAVFGKYFKRGGRDAEEYARQPEKIANVVYANRMDNGDTDSGDGWKFRGRGYIQLTGKHNYSNFAKSVGMSIDEVIEYLDTVDGALESALWFWKENGLNKFADKGDIKNQTKRINGGFNGLEDRMKHWDEIMHMIGGEIKVAKPESKVKLERVLRKGMSGADVKELQVKLGVKPVNGTFGPTTLKAVINFQRKHDLAADGIVGPKTFAQIVG